MGKTKLIQIRITEREFDKLQQIQERTHFSNLSEYVRSVLFNNNLETQNKFMKFISGLGLISDIPTQKEIRKIIREELNRK